MFGGNFAPVGWAMCQGQLMSIAQNEPLFALLGTVYGGDGTNTFALPDLQGRIPIHQGTGFVLGQKSGTETVTLIPAQLPAHSHAPQGSTAAAGTDPTNAVVGGPANPPPSWFVAGAPSLPLANNFLTMMGNSQPHENMMPFLTVTFIIALEGVFPSQN